MSQGPAAYRLFANDPNGHRRHVWSAGEGECAKKGAPVRRGSVSARKDRGFQLPTRSVLNAGSASRNPFFLGSTSARRAEGRLQGRQDAKAVPAALSRGVAPGGEAPGAGGRPGVCNRHVP
jgi:hypothetical protein